MLLGCIADDLTGATDLALMIARERMNTVQVIGMPASGDDFGDAEAVVVALKSRTNPPEEAVSMSLAAAEALRNAGAEQLFFKYCSTFDSTDRGNIGPVIDALMTFLGADFTIACPAFPANGRTIYQGHLFVGERLLSDSPMKDHPLTPMRDADLQRVLQRQTRSSVGLIPHSAVGAGPQAIRKAFDEARRRRERIVIVDAIHDRDLRAIGAACAEMALITGGSGVAMGLPVNFRVAGKLGERNASMSFPAPQGRPVILAGSCSTATRAQVKTAIESGFPAFQLDPLEIASGQLAPEKVVEWIVENTSDRPALAYSSADPASVSDAQARLGLEHAGALVEDLLANVARGLLARGFGRFLVAGGETSGAVVNALGVRALRIGPEIDPGVPWTRSLGKPDVALALKSGNFGASDFFLKAWAILS